MTDLYARLTYEEYKNFEKQLADYANLESFHQSTPDEKYYHRSFRLVIGDIILEVHGPLVKP